MALLPEVNQTTPVEYASTSKGVGIRRGQDIQLVDDFPNGDWDPVGTAGHAAGWVFCNTIGC